jgi:hypothetical protein
MRFIGLFMINIISGVVLLCAGGVALWYFKPHSGQLHWHTRVPILDSVIPVLIVAAFAVAVSIIVAGLAGFGT